MRTKERDEALKIIEGMTKAEIIAWLSEEIGFLLRPPSKSQLLFGRYQAASQAVVARQERNTLAAGVAKNIDALRTELIQAKDHKEFLSIAKRMVPYEKKFKAWIRESQEIRKEEEKVDAMWAAYMEQSEKESIRAGAGNPSKGGEGNG